MYVSYIRIANNNWGYYSTSNSYIIYNLPSQWNKAVEAIKKLSVNPKEGDWVWVKEKKALVRYTNGKYTIGFGYGHNWVTKFNIANCERFNQTITKATSKEIEEFLSEKYNIIVGEKLNVGGLFATVKEIAIRNDLPMFKIGNGTWISLLEYSEGKTYTFGGKKVIVDGEKVICSEIEGTMDQVRAIVKNPFSGKYFGPMKCTGITAKHPHSVYFAYSEDYLTLCPEMYNVRIGCLTGTYQELLNIIK